MITLKIPAVLIIRILLRLWQFLGALMLIGMAFLIFLSVEITFTHVMIQHWLAVKFILLIGAMLLLAEWVTMILFGEKLIP